jgi:hypothetical protein
MNNIETLTSKTVKELREMAKAAGLSISTRVNKATLIAELMDLSAAREEASEEEAEATSEVTEEGVKVVRKATLDIYSPEDLRGMEKKALADIARARAGKGSYSRMNKAQLIEVIQANPVMGRFAADATEEELEAMGKLARKATEEAREAKAPKAPKGAKAEKFLPAAPAPTPVANVQEKAKEATATPVEKVQKAEATKAAIRAKEAKPEPKKAEATKSDKKAETFKRAIEDLGWDAEISNREGERTDVTAKRGDETIKIHWLGGVFLRPNATYIDPLGRTILMGNASACLKQAEVSEEVALQKAQAKTESKKGKKGTGAGRPKNAPQAEEIPQEKLPFDAEESTAKEIIAAIEGKRVTWANSLSGKAQTAMVKPSKGNKIIPGTAKSPSPIIQFMTESGECAVRISSIKSVK